MASAGRILIMPKGNYDSSVTYEMLDLVYHNGKSWLAKKTAIGIEPSEANGEYWQPMSDFSLLDERKQDRKVETFRVPPNSSYEYEFAHAECCMLLAYVGEMNYSAIFSCCGINNWVYSINKLNEFIFGIEFEVVIGTTPEEGLNKMTFVNKENVEHDVTLIKMPFNRL